MSAPSVKTIGVVGGGQMGRGIAQVAAQSGFDAIIWDASAELADAARQRIGKSIARLVEKGKVSGDNRDSMLARITAASSAADLADCDLVVEAAPEKIEIKRKIFGELDQIVKADAVLASNTSSISITEIAASTQRPGKVIGMHFMNPVPVMKLVEIINGISTSAETTELTCAVADAMGKTRVTSADRPGFIVNRILIPMLNEACFALMEGVGTAEDIDVGIKLGLNHPMGPLALSDLIGLDTCLAIAEVLHRDLGEDKYRPCPLLRQHVAAGWLGRKTGRGFYRYDQKK